MIKINHIYNGDALEILKTFPDEFIDCVVTSPPYWGLRDYGVNGQLGLEKTPEEYVKKMILLFREIKRVLKKDGTVWLNLGDSYISAKGRYSSSPQTISNKYRNEPIKNNRPDLKKHPYLKDKDLAGIPWRVAFALQIDGWYLRQDIIWHKPNPMPESVKDRCTKAHEYMFLLTKSHKYYFDWKAIAEKAAYDGRKDEFYKGGKKDISIDAHARWQKDDNGNRIKNKRSVWTVPTEQFKDAHFAVYPKQLIIPCIKSGCPVGGIVLDPFMGSGTTAIVALMLERKYIGIELNSEYIEIARRRLSQKLIWE